MTFTIGDAILAALTLYIAYLVGHAVGFRKAMKYTTGELDKLMDRHQEGRHE